MVEHLGASVPLPELLYLGYLIRNGLQQQLQLLKLYNFAEYRYRYLVNGISTSLRIP
jgi:hypothetical protein